MGGDKNKLKIRNDKQKQKNLHSIQEQHHNLKIFSDEFFYFNNKNMRNLLQRKWDEWA